MAIPNDWNLTIEIVGIIDGDLRAKINMVKPVTRVVTDVPDNLRVHHIAILLAHGQRQHPLVKRAVKQCAAIQRCRDGIVQQFNASPFAGSAHIRSEEHTSELQSLMRISYAVLCLKKKKNPRI